MQAEIGKDGNCWFKLIVMIIYNFERCGVLALLQLCKVAGICSTAIKRVNIKNIDNNELKCFTKDALGAIFTIRVTFTILVQYFFLQTKLRDGLLQKKR